jgi:hypothetical protein
VQETSTNEETPENPFLKRKPRIWLIGNPEKLGWQGLEAPKADKYGMRWLDAVMTVHNFIFAKENVPYYLGTFWADDTLYAYESAKPNVLFSEQNYTEFNTLLKIVETFPTVSSPIKDQKKLFDYSPPITYFAVPEPDTPARMMFVASALAIQKEMKVIKGITEVLAEIVRKNP